MEDINKILEETKTLLKNLDELEKELQEMKRCKEFLIEQYKNHMGWFCSDELSSKVTIEDIIKTSFKFWWSSRRNFERGDIPLSV